MLQLLNWRIWAAVLFCAALAASHWKAYKTGAEGVQMAFDAYKNAQVLEALAAEKSARDKEHSMQSTNQKVTANYESLKVATTVAVGALDAERMRLSEALTASDPGANPAASACTDDAARVRQVVGQCAKALSVLAESADRTEDQLVGLQDYVNKVVPK